LSKPRLYLPLALLIALPALPVEADGQVNLRRYPVQRGDGETLEMDRTETFQSGERQRRFLEEDRGNRRMQGFREREAPYTADACGLGCEGHEGLQVRRIPGTRLSAVVYKTRLDDDGLTVQLRFHNDGRQPEWLTVDPSESWLYVQAGDETLHVRVDNDGELEAKHRLDVELEPGEIESWWARFPAPRSHPRTFDLHIPAVTFRDVPLATD
jgi:hypothetical protein